MTDKAFNEKPMIVVVSDALDPRIHRQLQAQLQSEMMTISQIDSEVKNQEASENIKQQLDSVKDESEFDDGAKPTTTPPAVEDQKATEVKPDATTPPTPAENTPVPPATPEQSGDAAKPTANEDPFGTEGDSKEPTPPSDNQKPVEQPKPTSTADENGDDPFGTQAPQQFDENNQQPKPDQNPAPTPPPQVAEQPKDNQPKPTPDGKPADGEDPFTDGTTFESFAGILGLTYKQEDAAPQTKSETPPLKQLVYIRGTDQGVDQRTSAVVASLEDPQNTVVVVDTSDIGEVEAKMQFSSLKKQLQARGITVVETTEQAVDYLNDVYEQMSGGGKDE